MIFWQFFNHAKCDSIEVEVHAHRSIYEAYKYIAIESKMHEHTSAFEVWPYGILLKWDIPPLSRFNSYTCFFHNDCWRVGFEHV